jgi:hypothetical protein
MTTASLPDRHRCLLLGFTLLLTGCFGCSRGDELSNYERKVMAEEEAAKTLRALGGKVSKKAYPQVKGEAYVVILAGVQRIDDETFDRIKDLGFISELDLSKTNVNDSHMDRVNEKEIGRYLIRLNLSQTAVTDQGLDKLDNLNLLINLNLTGTKTTKAGIQRLRQRIEPRRHDKSYPPFLPKQITIQR